MKNNICKIFILTIFLLILFGLSAFASFSFLDDFEAYPLTDSFGSTKWKTSDSYFSVESENDNKYLSYKSDATAYIQTLDYIDMSDKTTVVSMNTKANSKISVYLRGSGGSSENQVKLFSMSDIVSAVRGSDILKLDIIIYPTLAAKIYINNSYVEQINLLDKYPNFNLANNYAALRIYMTRDAYLDNAALYENISLSDDIVMSEPNFKINTCKTDSFDSETYPISFIKNGNIDALYAFSNISDKKSISLAACVYNETQLKALNLVSHSPLDTPLIKLELPLQNFDKGDEVKILCFDTLDNIKPLTKALMPKTAKYVREYPAELEAKFNKSGMHPRLVLNSDVIDTLKAKYKAGDMWCLKIKSDADKLLSATDLKYNISSGNLLGVSRETFSRITTLALTYHMTDDDTYLIKASDNMRTVCGFADWNPEHFFSCAEMTAAVSFGYDWLYDSLDEADIALLEANIYEKGLSVRYESYLNRVLGDAFFTGSGNKNLVYNAGMAIAALSVLEIYPKECFTIISEAMECIPEALSSLTPDGGWSEGTDYWRYGVNYLAMMMSSLESVYGTDFNISDFDSLNKTLDFITHMRGPCGYNNFHDSDGVSDTPAVFYLAGKYSLYDSASLRIKLINSDITYLQPFDLLYYKDIINTGSISKLPFNRYFGGLEAFSMRSSWIDDNAFFVSAHGGKNSGSHAHVDAGSFVFDYLGERWALDLGRESKSYSMNDSTSKNKLYRISAHGHNTIVINPDNEEVGQDTDANAAIIDSDFISLNSYVSYDMQSAYKKYVNLATRSFKFEDNKSKLKIIDYLDLKSTEKIEWYMHTDAMTVIDIDGKGISLTKNNKTIHLSFDTNVSDAVLMAIPAPNPVGEENNAGITKIVLSMTASGTTNICCTIEGV